MTAPLQSRGRWKRSGLADVIREMWTDDYTAKALGLYFLDFDLNADPPYVRVCDAQPPRRYSSHALDLTDWHYGIHRLVVSLDRQLSDLPYKAEQP